MTIDRSRLTLVRDYHRVLPGQTVVSVQTADCRVPGDLSQVARHGEPYTVRPGEYLTTGDHNAVGCGFALVDDDGRRWS